MAILLDQDERAAALDVNHSVIVQAPAGSGKTELLIRRFLRLLAVVERPEQILAITFTKKAAHEMRYRIIEALSQATAPAEIKTLVQAVIARDTERGWNLLQNTHRLRIQTIDSFSHALLQRLPITSKLGLDIKIAEDASLYYETAIQRLFQVLDTDSTYAQVLARVLAHVDNSLARLQRLCLSLLARRNYWLSYIVQARDTAALRQQLQQALVVAIEQQLQQAQAVFPATEVKLLQAILDFATDNLAIELAINALPAPRAEFLPQWRLMANLLLTDAGEWRKQATEKQGFPAPSKAKNTVEKKLFTAKKDDFNNLVQSLKVVPQLLELLAEIKQLPAPSYTDQQWLILQDLLTLLPVLVGYLKLTFQEQGIVDFPEVAATAVSALGQIDNPTDLALALDYQIQHLLIDEFQDTSSIQIKLVELLTQGWQAQDGRTLFLVGDPMQSIYRFRDANVSLFLKIWQGKLNQLDLKPVRLGVNFRSQQFLVDWFNQIFVRLFPRLDDVGEGAVTYSAATAMQAALSSQVSAIIFTQQDNGMMEALKVIELIQQQQAAYPRESLAVLVRSRSHLAQLIPLLKQQQIAYEAIDIDHLAHCQEILDLEVLTRALLQLGDRIAWLALLHSPLCGLSLEDIHSLVYDADPKRMTIWACLLDSARIKRLSRAGHKQCAAVIPILFTAIAQRERNSLREWIYATWLALSGPASLPSLGHEVNVYRFLDLLDELSDRFTYIDGFMLSEAVAKLYALPTTHTTHAVKLMTIHKAKGLEFDTVIIPGLGRAQRHDENPLMLWQERSSYNKALQLLISPIPATGTTDAIYDFLRREENKRSAYELDRLLYVAVTRAKKRLYLLGSIRDNLVDKNVRINDKTFLGRLWPMLVEDKKIAQFIPPP